MFYGDGARHEREGDVSHIGGNTELAQPGVNERKVVQVTFDPAKVSYRDLVDLFWYMHDPTTLNQQGHDYGTQYRSMPGSRYVLMLITFAPCFFA